MSRELALFPLEIVVFPGEAVNLHIFEPRYRQLLHDCRDNGITFGIPFYQNDRIMEYGTEMQLVNINKIYPGGEMDIKTAGMSLFKITSFYPKLDDCQYAGGEVSDQPYETREDEEVNASILVEAKKLFTVMNIKRKLPDRPADFRTYDIAHFVGFNKEEEYEFLTTFDSASRQQLLLAQIQKVLPIIREMEKMRNRAKLNGHFKHLIPPKT